jgi:hypothetical protein
MRRPEFVQPPLPMEVPVEPAIIPGKDGQFCGNCAFADAYKYKHRVIRYCRLWTSRKTNNGKLKVAARQPACELHKMKGTAGGEK